MRHLLSLILLLFLMSPPSVLLPQDAPCDPASLKEALSTAADSLTGPSADALTALAALKDQIAVLQSACAGLTFTSQEYGALAVIGPVDIPAGIYRATATTDGFFIMAIEVLEGDCDNGSLFNLSSGDATSGAQAIFRSQGCSVLIQTDNVSAPPWSLTFELIKAA